MYEIQTNELRCIYGDKIAFIFPSKILGGHELMAVEIIKDFLMLGVSVNIFVEPNNKDLKKVVMGIDGISNIIDLPVNKRRLESFSAIFDPLYLKKIRYFLNENFSELNKETIFLVQGDIEIGSSYVVAAHKENIKLISYIPFTHKKKKMKKSIWFFRDVIDFKIYNLVNDYVTIYQDAVYDLMNYNPNSHVKIIRNKVRNLEKFKKMRRKISKNKKIKIYIIGRVEFLQKGHDIFFNTIRKLSPQQLNRIELNIIGDGPDFEKLKMILNDFDNMSFKLHGWLKEPWIIAYDADLLIIPSNFEGVPLVMLEALEMRIDIIAKKIDGMIDYLDSDQLYLEEEELLYKISNYVEQYVGRA